MSLTDAQRDLAAAGQLDCPTCHKAFPYYDEANSVFFACPHCATYFKLETGKRPEVLDHFKAPHFVPQVLPLGATGLMPDGREYRIVGFMAKHEAKSMNYRWGEYALFSPPAHYAQLSVFEGHWQFIRPEAEHRIIRPNTREAEVRVGDDVYELYNKYSPRLQHAVGEFSWNARDSHRLIVQEFVAPPYMLVHEQLHDTASWFWAEHLEPGQVAEAFGLPATAMPDRHGVGAIQPPPGDATWKPLLTFTLLMALAVVLAQVFISTAKSRHWVLQETYSTQPDPAPTAVAGQGAVIVTPSFEVHGPTALNFELKVGLDNQWLELPVNLVNEQTGQSWEFTKTIEYYHGYEGGESWSEGSTEGDATLHDIPSGRYHVNLYPQSETGQPMMVQLRVEENTPLQSNLLLMLLLLFAWPVIQYLRRRYHTQQRWASSDYGPQE
ncbi:DUF4178 domain-containing protein [Hymenobacter gummosus]|uniref:DUF4178 domain-containing protein n=1 Tax=Hymenobacter gummosus TaxID=1776032 RepID=A0A3S0IKF0_9BACT|nr:DUF4178 domain-containing protein [Hymenobacter gummosus]RTQ46495.1 DUF4178 domain-containing protein [Hymenobacter gummosus]